MTEWDPGHYLRFGDERTRPAVDLASRVALDAPERIIDLGCGPGNSTEVLRSRWPSAQVCGLDSSPEMIAAARHAHPEHEWIDGRIEEWCARDLFDLVFSNAALQWTADHAALTRRLLANVARGGALAFQVPSPAYSHVRSLIEEVARDGAWVSRMGEALAELTIEEPDAYYDALAPWADSIDMWETVYYHVMQSPTDIVDWISSTGLRPFLDALDTQQERSRFTAMLTERVARDYTVRADGQVLFPFRRTFVIAYV